MEIILEIVFGLFSIILEAAFEILAQMFFELVAEIGLRSLAEPFRKTQPLNPILAGIGYVSYGAVAGGLSLLLPKVFAVELWLRLLNLIATPIVCGYIMAKVGQIRARRGESVMRMDTFSYGYLFALSMAVVRLLWR